MYAAVIYYVGLDHLVAVGCHHVGESATEKVVAHMTQMKRLVGVGA